MLSFITCLYLKLKKYLYYYINKLFSSEDKSDSDSDSNYTDIEFDYESCEEKKEIKPVKPIKLIKQNNPNKQIESIYRKYPKENIRCNTSPNLSIDRILSINWYCKNCKKKIYRNENIYCCNDFIFCTPNCRDRFLNFLQINNNI
jgi:hypothetical protein